MKPYVLLLLISVVFPALAQLPDERVISIEPGDNQLNTNQPFVLSVVVKNSANRPWVQFPVLPGLEKRSTSATTTTSNSSGQTVFIQTLSQQYVAKKEGTYEIPPFTMTVDGEKVKSEGFTLTFNKAPDSQKSTDAKTDTLELSTSVDEIREGSVFLSLKASKPIVFLREGFSVRLALYVDKSAPLEMEFFRLDNQLQEIFKKIRPATCWEENVGIEEIVQREVTVGGRRYTEYQMYQAVFFPITKQTVSFPAVGLDMLVLETLPDGSRIKKVKTFSSRPVRILVKPLPPHPRRDQMAVGQYRLKEALLRKEAHSGESVKYRFTVVGEGNLATISPPELPVTHTFDFYPPDVSQTVRRSNEKVVGEKSFEYSIVVRQKGYFPLGRFFQWEYFDPVKGQYSTLRSSEAIEVVGENLANASLLGGSGDPVYGAIEELDTTETPVDYQGIIRLLTNGVVIALMGAMLWVLKK